MTWFEPIITRLDVYGPLGLFLAFTLIVIGLLVYAIIRLDKERTKSAKDRALEWQAEREFYQNHFFTNFTQIVSLMAQHEERAQERHTAQLEQAHTTALILKEVSTMLHERR